MTDHQNQLHHIHGTIFSVMTNNISLERRPKGPPTFFIILVIMEVEKLTENSITDVLRLMVSFMGLQYIDNLVDSQVSGISQKYDIVI